jgi:hypothetical protein
VEPAEQTVMGIARGYQLSQALYVAAKLGVADVLDPQPLAPEAVACAVGAGASQLRRVLRALVAVGVFCELAASQVLRGARTFVDVGGGAGTLVAEVLRHHPEIAGVLVERPGMLALAEEYLADQAVADRCELASVPAGGDVYVLKSVLHDWDDERCVAILRSCRAAMDEAARLVIVELILPERITPTGPVLSAALLDLIMLAYAGGRERTEAEFAQLLDQASLRLARTIELSTGPHLLEAVAV